MYLQESREEEKKKNGLSHYYFCCDRYTYRRVRVPFARVADLENRVSLFCCSGSRVKNPRRRPARPRGRCTGLHSGSGGGGERERAHAKSSSGGDGTSRVGIMMIILYRMYRQRRHNNDV